jgi:outer membrane receptor protein involved in Fe transport
MFRDSGRTGLVYSAFLGLLLFMPTQALTQGDMVIEEIMVTATKREERLQDVPMAVSVLTEDEIQSRGIENPYDIARRTAGLDFQSASGLNSQYIIRGVSMSSSQGTKVDKTVMVYLDDMPITSSLNDVQAHLNLYDIGRIEVLKGPQGTLFGSGTLAGVVRMISNQPDPTSLDYSVKLEVGSTKGQMRQRVGGMVNIPLSDTMALRVVGYNNSEDGYNTNTYFGDSPY